MHALTSGQFAELDALFQQAAALDDAARAAFVADVRVRSPVLAPYLEAMLRADIADSREVGAIVADGARAALGVAADDALVGERFGAYRIERIIGHGGMGAVFLGSRADEEFHQTVAIKTIRAGRESPEALERFRREREILAGLNHPAIARLVDGGTGPNGVPFVAMEYVDGRPLLAYVAAQHLALRERLQLFLELCDAVDFVHRRLVVHRDIKPSNVLVTADGRVKLLDFGIAKLTDEFDAGPRETATLPRAMTPEYASPEQIQGHPVTTATDVYALGVLLYELLTGQRPVRWDSSHPYELAQAIVSETPPAPSDAVRRAGDAPVPLPEPRKKLARRLAGDLDRIVLKAIRKEPERRYASAAALAADVRAWLAGRPVSAQPDTWRYRVRRFVGRHPAAATAAVLFVAVVASFTAVTLRQARALARERDTALLAERQANANAAFLTKVFTTADPRHGGKRNMTAQDLLQSGVEQLDQDTSVDPRVRADLYLTLGRALVNLQQFDEGIAAIRRSLRETESVYGHESTQTAEVLTRLGDALREDNRLEDAHEASMESVRIRRTLFPGDSFDLADSYNNLAILDRSLGRYKEADDLQTASNATHGRLHSDPDTVAVGINNLALLRRGQGHLRDALPMAERAYEMLRPLDDPATTLWALGNVWGIRLEMGQIDDAVRMFEEIVTKYLELVPPTHTRILGKRRDIAYGRYLLGDYAEAERQYTALEADIRGGQGGHSVQLARVLQVHALLDRDLGRLDDAERRLRTALTDHLAATSPTHFDIPSMRRNLAQVLIDRGKLDEAESPLRTALALLPDAKTLPHIERARTLMTLARLQTVRRRWNSAGVSLREARQIVLATTGEGSLDMGRLLLREGLLAQARGDVSASRPPLQRAVAILQTRLPPQHHRRVVAEHALRTATASPAALH